MMVPARQGISKNRPQTRRPPKAVATLVNWQRCMYHSLLTSHVDAVYIKRASGVLVDPDADDVGEAIVGDDEKILFAQAADVAAEFEDELIVVGIVGLNAGAHDFCRHSADGGGDASGLAEAGAEEAY